MLDLFKHSGICVSVSLQVMINSNRVIFIVRIKAERKDLVDCFSILAFGD